MRFGMIPSDLTRLLVWASGVRFSQQRWKGKLVPCGPSDQGIGGGVMLRESKLSNKQSPVPPAAPDSSLGDSASLELRQAGACPLCLPNQAAFPLGFGGGDFSRLSAPCKGWKELRVAGLLDELGNATSVSTALQVVSTCSIHWLTGGCGFCTG